MDDFTPFLFLLSYVIKDALSAHMKELFEISAIIYSIFVLFKELEA